MAASSLQKAIRVLKAVIEQGAPVGVQQLAQSLGLNVSTVHRLLQALVREEMVSYEPRTHEYALGTGAIRVATLVLGTNSLVGRVRPTMRALADQLGEACALNLFDPHSFTMAIAVVELGSQPLGYVYDVGQRDPINAGASGKAILAFLSDAEIDAFFAHAPLAAVTSNTLIDERTLRDEIAEIRRRGYSMSVGERVLGTAIGIAAPVFGRDERAIGSLVLAFPAFRHRVDNFPSYGEAVISAARTLSHLVETDAPETLRRAMGTAA